MKTTALAAALALLAAGCASGGPPAVSRDAAPLFRTATLVTPAKSPVVAMPDSPNAVDGVSIEVRFETSKGETVLAPRLFAFLGGRANVQVVQQTAYIADFDVERKDGAAIMNPMIAIADEGIFLDLCARPGKRGTALAWALRTSRLKKPIGTGSFDDLHGHDLTIQLPSWERAEAEGLRTMEAGVWGLLARLPSGNGETVTVLARVAPEKVEFETKDEDARDIALIDPSAEKPRRDPIEPEKANSLPARAAKAAFPEALAGSLDLRVVTLVSDLPPGTVIEAEAAGGLGAAISLDPGAASVTTAFIPGVRVACLLDERYVKDFDFDIRMGHADSQDPKIGTSTSGLTVEVGEDGVLALRWVVTRWANFLTSVTQGKPLSMEVPDSRTHEARVIPGATPRLVVLAALPEGKVAAVLVRFRAE